MGETTPPDPLHIEKDGLPSEALARSGGWGLMLSGTREKHVSRISVGRYVRPFVWNNHYIVCDCNRIGGVARDDNLPQHLASASQAELVAGFDSHEMAVIGSAIWLSSANHQPTIGGRS